jgi:hypothetical protein
MKKDSEKAAPDNPEPASHIRHSTTKEYLKCNFTTQEVAAMADDLSRKIGAEGFETFITIEPILSCNPYSLAGLIFEANPKFVNIGADSKNHKLPEPSKASVMKLIEIIKDEFQIKKKINLARLLGGDFV